MSCCKKVDPVSGLLSLFSCMSNFLGNLMSKSSLLKIGSDLFNQYVVDKEAQTFAKGISSKANVIAWLESELVYFEAVVQHFSPYATGTPHWNGQVIQYIHPTIQNTWNLLEFTILCLQPY